MAKCAKTGVWYTYKYLAATYITCGGCEFISKGYWPKLNTLIISIHTLNENKEKSNGKDASI